MLVHETSHIIGVIIFGVYQFLYRLGPINQNNHYAENISADCN